VQPLATTYHAIAHFLVAYCAFTLLVGCQQKMADQPSYKPLDASDFYADGRSARLPVSGTVARGHLQTDRALFTGRISASRHIVTKPLSAVSVKAPNNVVKPNTATEPDAMLLIESELEQNNNFVDAFPLPVNEAFVRHGRDRYMIYCVVCHDPLGTGKGKIVERGYTRPPSYHIKRLREAPVGRLFAVITEGYGSMPSYATQIPVRDRWAIVSYVRALQLSQHFPAEQVPDELFRKWTREDHSAIPGTSP